MTTKRGRRSGASSTRTKSRSKPTPTAKPRAKPARSTDRAPGGRTTIPAAPPPRREAAPPSLLDRGKALRDTIQQSKLTAPDPWSYTPKARRWLARVEPLLDKLSAGVETAELRKAVDALIAEVGGDRDFQEAQRRS